MGLNRITLDFFHKHLKNAGINPKGSSILELGNQRFRKMKRKGPTKKYFESLGLRHTSIDTNGMDGARPLDLTTEIELKQKYDIVTNLGTSEHVPFQYPCWKNIHNFCRVGGLFIHVVPSITSLNMTHGYYRYRESFFPVLSEECGYELLETFEFTKNRKKHPQLYAGMIKTEDRDFVSPEIFDKVLEQKHIKLIQPLR